MKPRSLGARAPLLRLALLAVLLATGLVLVLTGALPGIETVREFLDRGGVWVPVLFVLGYVAATVMLVPTNVLSAAAGLAFGLGTGTVLVWLGAVAGAAAAFRLGRGLGRDGVEQLTGARLARLDALLGRHGFAAVLLVRLIPVAPFTLVNYGSGLTAVRFLPYLAATAVGILPGTLAYVAVGAYGTRPGQWPFLLAVTGLAVLTAGGLLGARRLRRATPNT